MENNNISKKDLMDMVSKHEMWYISHRLYDCDYDGNMKIQGVTIEKLDVVFKNATLHRSEFVNCIFNNISIIYCGFRGARFINCTFNNCYISCSDMTCSEFTQCEFNNVEFDKCSMYSSSIIISLYKPLIGYGTVKPSALIRKPTVFPFSIIRPVICITFTSVCLF